MKWTNIPPIEDAEEHLDIAFRKAKSKADRIKEKLKNKGKLTVVRIREIERTRFSTASDVLIARVKRIHDSFPETIGLPLFYQELVEITIDVDKYQKSLAALNWLMKKTAELLSVHVKRINRSNTVGTIHTVRKSFYGRLSSIYKKIDGELAHLNDVRRVMKTYPVLRDMPTVAIAGFPNVGKTTLLSKISSSTPEIAEYAFTTKHVNIGYISGTHKIQLIDTPGTLARPDKMNAIEKQAAIAIKYLAGVIVYVFDPTEPYPLEMQEKLLELLKKERKPIILYMSKADNASKSEISRVKSRYKRIISSAQQLKRQLQAFPSLR